LQIVDNIFIEHNIININFKPNFEVMEKGLEAPDFSFTDKAGKKRKLSDYRGRKVILYFYPKDSTPGCTAEACDFRDNYNMWLKKGYEVIGVSADSESSHSKFAEKHSLPFPLVADTEKEVIKAYGVWGPKKFMGRTFDGILRTTFIIDENGIIEEKITKVNTKASTVQILDLIK
jgi:peroxiredoxin Q/BCP